MKKKISAFLVVITVSLGLLTGCFGSDQEIKDIEHSNSTSFTGSLRVQTGVYADLPGTHFLETDSEKLPLSSLAINLSDSKYLNKEVEVTGMMKESTNREEFFEVESIKLLGDGNSEGSWEVYKNDTLGFKIAYQNNWTLDESAKDQVTFKSADSSGDKVVIARKAADKEADLKTTAIKFFGGKAEQATSSKVGKDSMDALKLSADNNHDIIYVFKRYEWAYLVTFDGSVDSDNVDAKNAFNQMMLDFQFLPIDGSASTETSSTSSAGLTDAQNAALKALAKASTWSSDLPENYKLLKAEFVGDSYVFVEYGGGDAARTLFSYSYSGGSISNVSTVAKYRSGTTSDWDLYEGSNPVLGKEKTVVNYKSSGELNISQLKAGYRYFQSDKYKFKMQYPSSWYYAGSSSSDGYHFGFSKDPVTSDNQLVGLDISNSNESPTSAVVSSSGNGYEVKIKGYTLKFTGDDSGTIKQMAESVEML